MWAISKEVDIINMSFGFDKVETEVDDALQHAREKKILVFAAMANEGIRRNAAWPAREQRVAIGIHSCISTGGGRHSDFTPLPVNNNLNFMVVGENINTHWLTAKGGGFRISDGTSFATPVAVAMAALILAFVNQKRCEMNKKECGRINFIRENWGMIAVLEKISAKFNGYSWIDPELLWAERALDDKDEWDQWLPGEGSKKRAWKVVRKALAG
jgi:hypothetical protein